MNLLLDTHAFLWYYSGSSDLSKTAKEAIENPENNFFVSIASFWEIGIKTSLGKLELDASLEVLFKDVVDKGFYLMPIDLPHILHSSLLPLHHRDPFDRLLVGQSLTEKMPIVSKDSLLEPYCKSSGLKVIW